MTMSTTSKDEEDAMALLMQAKKDEMVSSFDTPEDADGPVLLPVGDGCSVVGPFRDSPQ
jgi:hypothetical protein